MQNKLKKTHSTQQDVENKSRAWNLNDFYAKAWQKPTQYCKVIILQLKILKLKEIVNQLKKIRVD